VNVVHTTQYSWLSQSQWTFLFVLSDFWQFLNLLARALCYCHDIIRSHSCCYERYRCPAGKRLFQGSTWCENIDECSENPSLCYYGTCRDLEDGYACDCDEGYFGPTCRERRDTISVVVSTTAQLAIASCALVLLCEFLCRTLSNSVSLIHCDIWIMLRKKDLTRPHGRPRLIG